MEVIERLAPMRLAEEWDNPGLQVGSHSRPVGKVLVALDPTPSALEEAVKIGAQMLFTHHPLIFTPLYRLDINRGPGRVASRAIVEGIAIVSAHTNLDMAVGGINDQLAALFGLRNVHVLKKSKDPEFPGAGLGRVGDLPEPLSLGEVVRRTKALLEAPLVRWVGDPDRNIRRVAVIGGSGGSLVPLVPGAGADALITGDVDHHRALEAADLGVALIDGGHFHTEKTGLMRFVDRFRDALGDMGWEVGVEFYSGEESPMDAL